MSIATLKEELLRELAVAALDGDTNRHWSPATVAGTWSGALPRSRRQRVFAGKGPGLIVAHVKHGDRLWFAPGADRHLSGIQRVVVSTVVYRAEDTDGVTQLHVKGPRGLSSPFLPEGGISHFLANVLAGHVQDA